MSYRKDQMKCLRQEKDCKFIKNGICTILTDTFFERPCPFYKGVKHGKGKRRIQRHYLATGKAHLLRQVRKRM